VNAIRQSLFGPGFVFCDWYVSNAKCERFKLGCACVLEQDVIL
jgi:hypothetical protein